MVPIRLRHTFISCTLTAFFLCVLFCPPAHGLPKNKIISATHYLSDSVETVEIKTVGNPDLFFFRLTNPERIVCTIKNSYLPQVHHKQTVTGENITGFRISQNTPENARLVLDVQKTGPYKTQTRHLEQNIHLHRIIFPVKPFEAPDSFKSPVGSHRQATQIHTDEIAPILSFGLENKTLLLPKVSDQIDFPSGRNLADSSPIVNLKKTEHRKPTNPTVHQAPADTVPGFHASATPGKTHAKTNQPKTISLSSSPLVSSVKLSDFDDSVFDDTGAHAESASDYQLSGTFQNRGFMDTKDNHTNEQKAGFKNRSILKFSYQNTLVISALSDYLFFGNKNDTDSYDLDLYETYFRYSGSPVSFSIGKQIKRWGKADQISLVDTLNPSNNTEFIIPPYDEQKIPVWMAEFSFRKNRFFIETIFIPFFEKAKFDYFDTDWAVFTHLKNDINDSNTLTASQKAYFTSRNVQESEPDNDDDAFEYAARAGGTFNDIDLGLTYHYATEDIPHIDSFPVKGLYLDSPGAVSDIISNLGSLVLTNESILVSYRKTHIFGFEFETTVSDIGLRGEASFKENESFLTRELTSVRNPTISWIIGADYTSADNWYFNLQLAHQHIKDYHPEILIYDEDNISVIAEISKTVLSDWLKASMQGTAVVSDSSYYLSPRFEYTYIKNLELIFGFNIFEGSSDTIFGQYDDNDQVFLDVKYYF